MLVKSLTGRVCGVLKEFLREKVKSWLIIMSSDNRIFVSKDNKIEGVKQ
jgi:hypothetical protein